MRTRSDGVRAPIFLHCRTTLNLGSVFEMPSSPVPMSNHEYDRDVNVRLVQPLLKVQPDCALKQTIQNKSALRIGPIDREELLRREMGLVKSRCISTSGRVGAARIGHHR